MLATLHGIGSGAIRSLGFDSNKAAEELLEVGLIVPSCSTRTIEAVLSRNDLIAACAEFNIPIKPSWTKQRLAQAIHTYGHEVAETISETRKLVAPAFDRYPALMDLVKIAEDHRTGYELLCFAD